MTPEERQEKNRKIAEWLEPLGKFPPRIEADGYSYSPLRAWRDKVDGYLLYEPADFYADEAANALLLDYLLSTSVDSSDLPTHFRWAWQSVSKLIMEEIVFHQNNDRKNAIVNVALALIEAKL